MLRQRVVARSAAAYALAALLVVTGTWHFASPDGFRSIVPTFLGSARFWVAISGVAELMCAVGLVVPRTRRAAGWACVVLFVVVFPANVTMAVHALHGDGNVPVALIRLPLQIPLVLWAYFVASRRRSDQAGTLSGSSGPGIGSTGGGGNVSGVSGSSTPGSSGTGSSGSIAG